MTSLLRSHARLRWPDSMPIEPADMQRLTQNRDWKLLFEHYYGLMRGAQRDAVKMDAKGRECLAGMAVGMEMLLSAPYRMAGRDLPIPAIEQQGLQAFLEMPVRRGPRAAKPGKPVDDLDDWIKRAHEQGRY